MFKHSQKLRLNTSICISVTHYQFCFYTTNSNTMAEVMLTSVHDFGSFVYLQKKNNIVYHYAIIRPHVWSSTKGCLGSMIQGSFLSEVTADLSHVIGRFVCFYFILSLPPCNVCLLMKFERPKQNI